MRFPIIEMMLGQLLFPDVSVIDGFIDVQFLRRDCEITVWKIWPVKYGYFHFQNNCAGDGVKKMPLASSDSHFLFII